MEPRYTTCQKQQLGQVALYLGSYFSQALAENIPEGFAPELSRTPQKHLIRDLRICPERQGYGLIVEDLDSFAAVVRLPVVLIGEVLLLKFSRCELTVIFPRRALLKYPPDMFLVFAVPYGSFKQNFIHEPSSESDFARGLEFHFMPAHDIGKVRCRGTYVYHQNRL